MLGPLFVLKVKGLLCPCLENEEDTMARPAAVALSSVPVHWYRPVEVTKQAGLGSAVSSMVSSWMGGSSSNNNKNKDASVGNDCHDPVVNAMLSFQDSIRGPCMVIEKYQPMTEEIMKREDGQEVEEGECTRQSWLLTKLENAISVEAGYFIGGSTAASSGIAIHKRVKGGSTVECCKVDLCCSDSNFETLADSNERDDIVDKINIILSWNRQQKHNNQQSEGNRHDDDDDDDDDDDGNNKRGNIIKEHAKKAAHFAKREIEMKTQKRDREKRKARYLKETGGLKYTAIAMANKAEMS